MSSTQMEEHNESDAMGPQLQDGNNIHRSSDKIEHREARKQYHLLNVIYSRINHDIDQRKVDELQINRKLMWFSQLDKYIQWKKQKIKNLEGCLGKGEIHLPTNLLPHRTGFFCLPENDAQVPLRPDQKRNQKRLIKKGRMDMDYLQQVQDELLSSKKSEGMTSSGTQEVNNLIENMVQTIQHGNKCRAYEMRVYHEMRNVKETREIYTAPEEPKRHSNHWYLRERTSKRDIDSQRFIQHKINIALEDLEELEIYLKQRKARVARLKAKLEFARKSSGCLLKKLEDVKTKKNKAYERAYELVDAYSMANPEFYFNGVL